MNAHTRFGPLPAAILGLLKVASATSVFPGSGAQTILSWAVPNDGRTHHVFLIVAIYVGVAETGGELDANQTLGGAGSTVVLIPASQAVGAYQGSAFGLAQPGSTVSVTRTADTTGSIEVVQAEIWSD